MARDLQKLYKKKCDVSHMRKNCGEYFAQKNSGKSYILFLCYFIILFVIVQRVIQNIEYWKLRGDSALAWFRFLLSRAMLSKNNINPRYSRIIKVISLI